MTQAIPTMTAAQFVKALDDLGISKEEASLLLGTDERTPRRWASGERDVPGPVVRFLRYLLATKKSGSYAIKQIKKGRS